jgi:hypothetical protein
LLIMSQSNSSHFHNGKAARARGEACIAPTDARLAPESRQLWYDGWNHQDALMRPVPTNEEIEDTASFLRGLKQSVKEGSL